MSNEHNEEDLESYYSQDEGVEDSQNLQSEQSETESTQEKKSSKKRKKSIKKKNYEEDEEKNLEEEEEHHEPKPLALPSLIVDVEVDPHDVEQDIIFPLFKF